MWTNLPRGFGVEDLDRHGENMERTQHLILESNPGSLSPSFPPGDEADRSKTEFRKDFEI